MIGWRGLGLVAGVLLPLGGCLEDGSGPVYGGGSYNRPPPPNSYRRDADDLTRGQRAALEDGCRARYRGHSREREKVRECMSGDSRASSQALIDGCYHRYKGIPHKLRQCLDAL